jgi:hypothetical protein
MSKVTLRPPLIPTGWHASHVHLTSCSCGWQVRCWWPLAAVDCRTYLLVDSYFTACARRWNTLTVGWWAGEGTASEPNGPGHS